MTAPIRYESSLTETIIRASECYRRRDDDGTAQWLSEAVRLAPWRTDLRFCLAGRHIQHGVPELAIPVYEETLRIVPGDVDALFFSAHWRRHAGDLARANERLAELRLKNPGKAEILDQIWSVIDQWKTVPVTDALPDLSGFAGRLGVVILGLLLNDDGTPRPGLIRRLEKGLAVLESRPDAVVVVSGGMPRSGRVEAVVMREWLEARGIAPERIHEEGYSRDVIENLLFSREILAGLGVDGVIGVSCAINARRTGSGLEILSKQYAHGWKVWFAAASGDTFANFKDDGSDDIKLYRDILRVYGIPMMNSYPYLAER